jgi:AraC family transcriptional regulator, regulatory protein of adaptative response / DNA-3-methyladenine glycosylase II
LKLEAGADPESTIKRLVSVPGIGPWTAHYIAMRGLRWPDAFPKEDIAVRGKLGGVSAARAEELSQAWRPWRSYAVMHIWNQPKPSLSSTERPVKKRQD